ncbi:MAG: phosphoenolpyruvate carboxylase [Polyangiaceae bacterium]
MMHVAVILQRTSTHRDKERTYEERVLSRYRLYCGLFLGLPFERLQRTAQLLPVFAEHCRRHLEQGVSPTEIVDRFFSETPILADVERTDVEFLFLQLVERQIVLFDALEDAGFSHTHDRDAPGSVSHLIESVARDDLGPELGRLLERTSTRIVLTAHPTQFYPATVQGIISDLRSALIERDSAEVERLLLQLGKTRFTNRVRPTPVEEAERVLDVVMDVFFEVLPNVAGRVLVAAHGREHFVRHLSSVPNLQLGFWPGGDRDGNPFVTAATTAEVARILKTRLLGCYVESAAALSRRLTFEGAHEAVLEIIGRLQATLLEARGNDPLPSKYPERKNPYGAASELLDDVIRLRELVLTRHQGLFVEHIDDFLLKVHLFGFYFAALDVRQNSDVFRSTLRELASRGAIVGATDVSNESFDAPSLDQLATWLGVVTPVADSSFSSLSPLAADTLLTLRLVDDVQLRNGPDGLHRVVISHTRNASDVAIVLLLARLAGHDVARGSLDIVPLFESIEDLDASERTLSELFDCAAYREYLAKRGNRQNVMVGFSDGTKDGGYFDGESCHSSGETMHDRGGPAIWNRAHLFRRAWWAACTWRRQHAPLLSFARSRDRSVASAADDCKGRRSAATLEVWNLRNITSSNYLLPI